jgi:hypothetical protein
MVFEHRVQVDKASLIILDLERVYAPEQPAKSRDLVSRLAGLSMNAIYEAFDVAKAKFPDNRKRLAMFQNLVIERSNEIEADKATAMLMAENKKWQPSHLDVKAIRTFVGLVGTKKRDFLIPKQSVPIRVIHPN